MDIILESLVVIILSVIIVHCQLNSTDDNWNDTETLTTETIEVIEFNSTEPNTLNITEYVTENAEVTSTMSPEHHDRSYKPNYHCSCDLLVNHCDINCCCDADCSPEDLKTFTSCGLLIESSSKQYCLQKNFIFVNNTPYVMTKMSNNLFCIYKDNNKPIYFYKEITPITDQNVFDSLLNEYQTFNWQIARIKQQSSKSDGIKVGSPITIVFDSGRIGYLSSVKRFMNGLCSVEDPTAYLIDVDNDCQHQIENLQHDCTQNKWLNSQTYFANFKIVRCVNANFTDDILEPIIPRICYQIAGTSIKTCDKNVTEPFPSPIFNMSTKICQSAVQEVLYRLIANGTFGIVSATVDITLADITEPQLPVKWVQKHAVQFIKWSESNSNSTDEVLSTLKLSGNPGYIVGNPVLAGNRVDSGHLEDGQVAVELNIDSKKWLTIIDPRQSFSCKDVTKLAHRLAVTFNNDMKTGCVLEINLDNFTNNACTVLQTLILDSLLTWNPPDVVGTFGNSSPHKQDQWIPIIHKNKPPPSQLVNDFVCTNIVKTLQIVILFANTGSFYHHQSKIIGVKFQYDLIDLSLDCKDFECDRNYEGTLGLQIQTSVEFVDVSDKAVAKFAQPPPIYFELPPDFFYPFAASPAIKLTFSHPNLILCSFIIANYVKS